MSMRLTTIVKPPSIMRVELMKRRGIMATWPMAMLATQGIMQRKLVNITLRNTAQKNKPWPGIETTAKRPAIITKKANPCSTFIFISVCCFI